MPQAEVWFLDHSGFAVQTESDFMIFDYYTDTPSAAEQGLAGGVIDPEEIKGRQVTVFSSHRHPDHFNLVILEWESAIPTIQYVLSHDIRKAKEAPNALEAKPGGMYEVNGTSIRTLKSTDEGVAFLVQCGGFTIYHAGDLNWWHWEGESKGCNNDMAARYKEQIDTLAGTHIDLAFLPADPRLNGQYLWGMRYFMEKTDTDCVFPMHFWGDYAIFDRLQNDPLTAGFRDKIKRITHRGQHFIIEK